MTSFDDVAAGRLPKAASDPSRYSLAYSGGEYAIRTLDPAWDRFVAVAVPGTYEDTRLAVDVRLVDQTAGRYVVLICRAQPQVTASQYRLVVASDTQAVLLARYDRGAEVASSGWTSAPPLLPGTETNRLELACVGPRITVRVNGADILAMEDRAYRSGKLRIGAGTTEGRWGTVEARFDNLVVSGGR